MFDAFRSRLRNLVRHNAVTGEMEEEFRHHLEQSEALFMRRGLSPDDARLAAREAMGNSTILAEESRMARGEQLVDDIRRDVQHATRALARTPGFTAVVVVTLALGFGVNGAFFSMLKRAMSPTSIPDAESWLRINDHWSWEEYQQLSRDTKTMSAWSASATDIVLLGADTRDQDPQTIRAEFVTDGFFPSLRGRALLGRVFTPAEVAPPVGVPAAVLSHSLWRRRFNSDSAMVGRTIRLADGQPFQVIGVMPQAFTGTSMRPPDVWLPLGTRARLPNTNDARLGVTTNWFGSSGRRLLFLHARLAPGATLEAARTELQLRIEQFASHGDSARGRSIASNTHLATRSGINGPGEVAGVALVIGAGFSVLLIASVTVANLMLARAATRRREMGLRLALGASRSRVLRSWITECFVLSLAAAVTGLTIASWTVRAIVLSPTFTALARDVDPLVIAAAFAPDVSVFMYLVLLTIPTTLVFGLVPALRATRDDPLTAMRTGAGSAGSTAGAERVFLRRGLVISQVALTMVLLLASATMLRGVQAVSRVDPGFNRRDVLAITPSLAHSGYDSARAGQFMEEFLSRLTAIPGVRSVTRGNVPLEQPTVALVKRPDEVVAAEEEWNGYVNAVRENFFETLDIRLVRGRSFTRAEVQGNLPVVVISERTAETLWPDQEPIGKVISVTPLDQDFPKTLTSGTFAQARVIGVVRDAQMTGVGIWPRRYVYLPSSHWTPMVRTNGDIEVVSRVRALVRLIDPNVMVHARTLEDAIWASSGWLESAKIMTKVAAAMGILSLMMAVVGLFGLTAYGVEQRTRELGVRMALGAGAGNVLRLVTGQSLKMVAIGAAIGLAGGVALGGVLRSQLLGAKSNDPIVYLSVIVLLSVVSILACVIPARRATRVDPMVALRTD
jgi:predicted permease